jgi:hypothetical protein
LKRLRVDNYLKWFEKTFFAKPALFPHKLDPFTAVDGLNPDFRIGVHCLVPPQFVAIQCQFNGLGTNDALGLRNRGLVQWRAIGIQASQGWSVLLEKSGSSGF